MAVRLPASEFEFGRAALVLESEWEFECDQASEWSAMAARLHQVELFGHIL
jgi:hypothetical protein